MISESNTSDFEEGTFFLYDLKVEVIAPEGSKIWCNAKVGDYFEVKGELLHFHEDMPFSLYNLAALLPLLPAKQRQVDKNDWMFTDTDIACTDPNCPTRFRITRTGLRKFRHDDTTAVSQSFSTLD